MPPIEFYINPGTATPEEIAEIMIAMSEVYRSYGGPGLQFAIGDAEDCITLPDGRVLAKVIATEATANA